MGVLIIYVGVPIFGCPDNLCRHPNFPHGKSKVVQFGIFCDLPSMYEISELVRDGGGVWYARGKSFHHQLQLLEDVHIFREWIRKTPDGQLKL